MTALLLVIFCIGRGDYEARKQNVVFEAGKTRKEYQIVAIDDNTVEKNEYFYLRIAPPQYRNVHIDRHRYRYNTTKITIYDDDSEYLHNLSFYIIIIVVQLSFGLYNVLTNRSKVYYQERAHDKYTCVLMQNQLKNMHVPCKTSYSYICRSIRK